jgi:serine protease Do
VITALDGKPVDDSNALRNHIAAMPPGSEVTLTILRDGKELQLRAKLMELKADAEGSGSQEGGSEAGSGQLGVTVEPRRNGQGVVITDVEPGSPAAEAGLQPDDVILEVNHQPVKSATDLRAGVRNSGSRPTLLLVSHQGRNVFVAIQAR